MNLFPDSQNSNNTRVNLSEMGSNRLFASASSSMSREFFRLIKVGIESMSAANFVRRVIRIERSNDSSNDYYLNINSPKYSQDGRGLLIEHEQQPADSNRFQLNRNVYVAAFGKAALG